MSTVRRPLGTGPNTTAAAPAGTAPRLLPAERAEQSKLLADVDVDQAAAVTSVRRPLGPGRVLPQTPS
ncbi:hypothetical protein ABZ353_26515 [Streptomyces niveus]|uniref:hypothetical protein n=1 Tax=Streptomyces niveus TaxID=193462 RepID=UPI0033CFA88B